MENQTTPLETMKSKQKKGHNICGNHLFLLNKRRHTKRWFKCQKLTQNHSFPMNKEEQKLRKSTSVKKTQMELT
jgi:hypothetical protein